ncbi:hypothetical protein I601_1942 [Nocardioides dokdonensis FR1436]|uniref:PH domain-containing protein n=1 Tax=Nocardioides dokdonensis FR1436 TaxID=1300347 RepID=A0A1A9GLL5_9ACTN|nr:PH domain-containing protein [Nocardioides dokdonensis]ANH38371.1 hypothetical protein I601_1942 [Nocardioides dokdonensis FR1436]
MTTIRDGGPLVAPDAAYRSLGRYAVLALIALLVPIGALFAVAGLRAEQPAFPVALGALLVVMGVAGAGSLTAPRHGPRADPPPAVAVEGGLALPLRRAHVLMRAVVGAAIAGLGVGMVLLGGSATRPLLVFGRDVDPRVVGVLVVLGVVAAAVLATRTENRLVVGPDGVRMPGGLTRARTVPWRDIAEVGAVRGWQPHLVVAFKGPGLVACRLLPQAWPASSLVALLEHHRRKAGDRGALVHPDAVERFRT